MKTVEDNIQESQNSTIQKVSKESSNGGTAELADNREATSIQRKLNDSIVVSAAGDDNPIQRKNNTGLPDNLKSGIENLSGYSMDDVKVHYNSSKPAQLQAHAYAQGTDIHISSGQEKHLPHEAWHVVQQKQGRVKPTRQLKSKVNINDNAGLENEADVMGGRAEKTYRNKETDGSAKISSYKVSDQTIQRKLIEDNTGSIRREDEDYVLVQGERVVPSVFVRDIETGFIREEPLTYNLRNGEVILNDQESNALRQNPEAITRNRRRYYQAVVGRAYENLRQYHGTHSGHAESIKQNGFNIGLKGKGYLHGREKVEDHEDDFLGHNAGAIERTARYNYFSSIKTTAKYYAERAIKGTKHEPKIIRAFMPPRVQLETDPDEGNIEAMAMRTPANIARGYVLDRENISDDIVLAIRSSLTERANRELSDEDIRAIIRAELARRRSNSNLSNYSMTFDTDEDENGEEDPTRKNTRDDEFIFEEDEDPPGGTAIEV